MTQAATRKDIDEVIEILNGFMGQMDQKFGELQTEVTELKESHDRLLNTIDAFIGRIDKYETELAARDAQFEKLVAWAKKVSEKTGIPLENL